MANPSEYREMLYQVLYLGELTPEMQAKAAKNKAATAKKSIGRPTPRKALDQMAAMEEQIAQIKAKRTT